MAKEKNYFVAAVTISAVCHLFWFSVVDIVAAAHENSTDDYTEINFLGPILEKTAFDVMIESAPVKSEILYSNAMMVKPKGDLSVSGPGKVGIKNPLRGVKNIERDDASFKTAMKTPAEIAPFNDNKALYYHIKEKELNKFIEGPAKARPLIYRPELPVFEKKFMMVEESFVTKFRFTISDSGNIETVEPVVSSGYPNFDVACIKYIRQWRFAPSYYASGQDKDWGIATINIRLK